MMAKIYNTRRLDLKWSAYHYNALAKEIRELLEVYDVGKAQFHAIVALAINLAKRFQEDNPRFDPVKFLNQCSPDVKLYPLGKLWG